VWVRVLEGEVRIEERVEGQEEGDAADAARRGVLRG